MWSCVLEARRQVAASEERLGPLSAVTLLVESEARFSKRAEDFRMATRLSKPCSAVAGPVHQPFA